MRPVSLVHTDGSLKWQHRLRSLASAEITLASRGLKYLCHRNYFGRLAGELKGLPSGLVFLGSSSFHHLSYHLLRRHASAPLALVVFDGHGDYLPAPADHISCGSWLLEALRLPAVQAVAVVGPLEGRGAEQSLPTAVRCFPPEEAKQVIAWAEAVARRVYVSIDKDVTAEASTDWGSGPLPATVLLEVLRWMGHRLEVVGADVCGESVPGGPWPTCEEAQAIRRNEDLNLAICRALCGRQLLRSSA